MLIPHGQICISAMRLFCVNYDNSKIWAAKLSFSLGILQPLSEIQQVRVKLDLNLIFKKSIEDAESLDADTIDTDDNDDDHVDFASFGDYMEDVASVSWIDRVDFIVVNGPRGLDGPESLSTVVDLTSGKPVVIREGRGRFDFSSI